MDGYGEEFDEICNKILADCPADAQASLKLMLDKIGPAWTSISEKFSAGIKAALAGESMSIGSDDVYWCGMGPTDEAAACAAADLTLIRSENAAF